MPKAKNLIFLRKRAGLTQQALADATGFAKSTINAWETKKRSIPKNRSLELCDYFGVTYKDFCDEDFELLTQMAKSGDVVPTGTEAESILMFRALPPTFKKLIKGLIRAAYENTKGDAP